MEKKYKTFDVTPKEYAARLNVHPDTARKEFAQLHESGNEAVKRCGGKSDGYPHGKLFKMAREYFDRLFA